jgi:hypothetical protein
MTLIFTRLFNSRILRHLLFWILVISFYTLFFGRQNKEYTLTMFFISLLMPVTIGTTYFINYYLIPKYLLKGKYKSFALYFIYTINFSVYLDMIIILVTFMIMADYKAANMAGATMDIMLIIAATFMVVFFGVAIKLIFLWIKSLKQNQKLMMEKVESELKFLKTQIHPHFLFNTLNNLYSLTVDKSDKAPEVVLKLSELLNYMLYECSPKFVPLEKEIAQLQNYINLESLRYSDRLNLELKITGEIKGQQIAPLLLITLLENCFKHGVMRAIGKSWIRVEINSSEEKIYINISNSKGKSSNSGKDGIGLQNLQNQLNLLYDGKHTFSITDKEKEFVINLRLEAPEKLKKELIYAD